MPETFVLVAFNRTFALRFEKIAKKFNVDTLSYKTKSERKEDVKHNWHLVDAEGQTLGRMVTQIATLLRGKHKPSFTPHVDCGDFVVVINAEKIHLTGKKWTDKVYVRHTGYPGGQRFSTPAELLQKHPERIVEKAVKGMLPKNKLGSKLFKKLFVYTGSEHPHFAQKPEPIKS